MIIENMDTQIELVQVLDLDILEQYTQAIGGKVLLGSVDLFAEQYPQYLKVLRQHYDNGDYDSTAAEGHKMKGAAGSIGLARLSLWGQMIQSRDQEQWVENTAKVIKLLESTYVSDIETLRSYLNNC